MRLFVNLGALIVATALICAVVVAPAQAQQPAGLPSQPAGASGWTFNIAPYMWLPWIDANIRYNLPPALGGRLPTDTSSGPGAYLSKLHFAGMLAADAQHDRISLLTDFVYIDGGTGSTNIKSLDFFGLPSHPIARTLETSTGTTLKAAIWTLTGGYTVARGDWGNFDLIAGFRLLNVNPNTNYNLALSIAGPHGGGAVFGGVGSISDSDNIWNGVAGFRGRIGLPLDGLFIPYHFDIGAGGSNLTWQIATGLAYQTGWAGVSVLYRYLSFEQGNSSVVRHLSLNGPMVMGNFSF